MEPQTVLDEPDSYAVCAGTSALFMELAASPRVHDTFERQSGKWMCWRSAQGMCSLVHSCSADNLHHGSFAISTDKGTAAAAAGWRTCWLRGEKAGAAIPCAVSFTEILTRLCCCCRLADVLAQGHSISASEKACIC